MIAKTFDRRLYLFLHRMGRMGRVERATLDRLILPGMTVVDIGSNLGLYTVFLSRRVGPRGRVIAFEPDPEMFALLRANCEFNGCTNVTAYNLALGSRRERLTLKAMWVNSGENHIGVAGRSPSAANISVDVATLDEICSTSAPDFVKIDVQGWELEVLNGMRGLIDANPPLQLYLEFWPAGLSRSNCSGTELARWLIESGFRLFRADNMRPLDESSISELAKELTGLKHADIFAIRR